MTEVATRGDGEIVYLLTSYWYMRRVPFASVVLAAAGRTGRRVDVLADSGGFSAYTVGAQIDVDAYADWLVEHREVINAAAGLDVIGDYRATARNTDRLVERMAGRVEIVPVFHVGTPWAELRRLCREHPYVGLGGAVGLLRRRDAMGRWLVECHRIGRDTNTRFHGFGQTRPPFPEMFPWYSIDSSYWSTAVRAGRLALWDASAYRMDSVGVGGQFARTVSPRLRAARRILVRDYGGDVGRVCGPGFGLSSAVGSDRAREDRVWMRAAGIESMRRYNEHMRARVAVDPPRAGPTVGTGPKLYLAGATVGDIDEIVGTARIPRMRTLHHAAR
jgi:hypothetical protein